MNRGTGQQMRRAGGLTPQQQQQQMQMQLQMQMQQAQAQAQLNQPLVQNGRFALDAAVYDIFRLIENAFRPEYNQQVLEALFVLLDDFDNRCDQVQLYCVCSSSLPPPPQTASSPIFDMNLHPRTIVKTSLICAGLFSRLLS